MTGSWSKTKSSRCALYMRSASRSTPVACPTLSHTSATRLSLGRCWKCKGVGSIGWRKRGRTRFSTITNCCTGRWQPSWRKVRGMYLRCAKTWQAQGRVGVASAWSNTSKITMKVACRPTTAPSIHLNNLRMRPWNAFAKIILHLVAEC